MTYLTKYGKRLLWMLISLFISTLIITALYHFNIIKTNTFNVLKITILLINIFISTYILGKNTDKLGFLEGIKFSIIIILLFLLTSLLVKANLSLKVLIYYSIIMITSIFGATIGINKKKEK